MKPNVPTRRALAVVAVLVAAAIALPRFLTHTPYQRLGAGVDRDGYVNRVVGPPAKGMLQTGDRLMFMNGLSLADSAVRAELRTKGWPRGPIEVTLERRGEVLVLEMPPVQLSAWQRLRIYSYPIAAVIAAPLVAFLLVWRRPDLSPAWVFLWFATLEGLGVIFALYQFPQGELSSRFRLYVRVYEWIAWFYPASFLHFMSVFPRPRWTAGGRVRSPWFWLTVAAYLTPVVFLVRSLILHTSPSEATYQWFQTAALVLGTLSLLERYTRPGPQWNPTVAQRTLALLVALALLVGAAFNLFGTDPRLSATLPPNTIRVLFTGILIAWLSTPLLIAYLIADDPLFDPRRLIVGGLPYALLSGVLAAIYLAVVLAGQRMFASVTGEQTLVFNIVAALILAFAFAPLRERVQRGIDRVYGRDPRALRLALDTAGRELLSALHRGEVRAAVERGITNGMRRTVPVDWPEDGPPKLTAPEDVPEDARGSIDSLLMQARIRLENLALAEQRAAAERNAVELREAATRAELRALQAQVQPHFLFNALNALAYLIETDPPAAQRFTERLADMLRYTVEANQRPAALLSEEIEFVEDYLGVARERYENPLYFEFRGPPALLSTAVPPLLLQPLVENSLKHGVAPGLVAMHMELEAHRDGDWIDLTFADDGNPSGNGGPSLGVGLGNLEQRVRRFAGAEARMTAGPREGGGYAVHLRWLAPDGGTR